MAHRKQASAELTGLTPQDRYTHVLEEWKQASQQQVAALEVSDWAAFDGLIEYKGALMRAWEKESGDVASLTQQATPATRQRWAMLAQEAAELDGRLEGVVRGLMDEVKGDLRQFGKERRVARKYRAMPREFTPSFHDKKY